MFQNIHKRHTKKPFTQMAKFVGVFFAALITSYSASAQFASSPCDPNYYQSLESRAWLEAQREITQNQNLIFKPDSVLEYTCFDKHLSTLALYAKDMFSETNRWGGSILSNQNTHMDSALISLVLTAFHTYDQTNFNHDLLGGRATGYQYAVSSPPLPPSGNIGGTYTCDIMQAVWQKAKCMNFIDSTANDGFFTFKQYDSASTDKRFLPTACPKLTTWQTELDKALPPVGATTPWDYDDVNTYFPVLFPTSGCGTASSNHVETGLVVFNNNGTPLYYNEHVCVVPGCYWKPTGTGTAASPSNSGSCLP